MKRFAWVIITTSAGKGAIDLCWCHILCCFSPWVIMLPHCSSSQLHFSVSCPVEMSSTLLSEHKLTRVWAFVKVHTFSSPLLSYIWVRDQSRGERQRDQCCKYLAKYSQVCVYSALDQNTFLTPSGLLYSSVVAASISGAVKTFHDEDLHMDPAEPQDTADFKTQTKQTIICTSKLFFS